MRICIDPGHSGPAEPGACAAGFTEAAINLAIAFRLGSELAASGYDVIYTRAGDITNDSLAFRADIANEVLADCFLSIHCNAAESTAARGVEVYCYLGATAGRRLAGCIQDRLVAADYTLDRGVKEANFAVLRLTDMPAVLVECGFITADEDRAVIVTEEGQRTVAVAIAYGLRDYLDGGRTG